jgi:RimJ/RimL family protein N-acetyltransferase
MVRLPIDLGTIYSIMASSTIIFAKAESSLVTPDLLSVSLSGRRTDRSEFVDRSFLFPFRDSNPLIANIQQRPYLHRATMNGDIDVSIRPYAEGDLWLLERTLGNPGQMVHLNGPESIEHIRKRHNKFLAMSADPHAGCQFTILAGSPSAPAGNVGYWESEWKGKTGWELGWFVLPELQRRGIATAATRLVIDLITKLESHKFVFAFPSVDNHQSNAICRKLGFTLTEQASSEYPPGSKRLLRCNIWMLTLPGSGIDTSATS